MYSSLSFEQAVEPVRQIIKMRAKIRCIAVTAAGKQQLLLTCVILVQHQPQTLVTDVEE